MARTRRRPGSTTPSPTAERSVPHLPMRDVITSFAGLRAHLTGGDDFVIGESCGGFFRGARHRVAGAVVGTGHRRVSGAGRGGKAGARRKGRL